MQALLRVERDTELELVTERIGSTRLRVKDLVCAKTSRLIKFKTNLLVPHNPKRPLVCKCGDRINDSHLNCSGARQKIDQEVKIFHITEKPSRMLECK